MSGVTTEIEYSLLEMRDVFEPYKKAQEMGGIPGYFCNQIRVFNGLVIMEVAKSSAFFLCTPNSSNFGRYMLIEEIHGEDVAGAVSRAILRARELMGDLYIQDEQELYHKAQDDYYKLLEDTDKVGVKSSYIVRVPNYMEITTDAYETSIKENRYAYRMSEIAFTWQADGFKSRLITPRDKANLLRLDVLQNSIDIRSMLGELSIQYARGLDAGVYKCDYLVNSRVVFEPKIAKRNKYKIRCQGMIGGKFIDKGNNTTLLFTERVHADSIEFVNMHLIFDDMAWISCCDFTNCVIELRKKSLLEHCMFAGLNTKNQILIGDKNTRIAYERGYEYDIVQKG